MKCALEGCENEFEQTRKGGRPQKYCCRLHNIRDSCRRRRLANPEKERERARKNDRRRRLANPEKKREQERIRYWKNPQKARETGRKAARRWRLANPEKEREIQRIFRLENPEKAREYSRRKKGKKALRHLIISLSQKLEKSNERNDPAKR